MNTPSKSPFIGWGFYSTPEGRGGIGSKSLTANKVDLDLFDWQTEIAVLLKVKSATPNNPPSLYNLGLRHDETHGQMLFIRQAQHAFEVNTSRAGTYISSFITTGQAYFKREAVMNILQQLHEMCRLQRKEFLDEQGKFKFYMNQFRSKEVPELGLTLQNSCVPANDFMPLKEVKPQLWILAQDNKELAQAVEAIVGANLFKNYQEFYLTSSPDIINNARLEPGQYVPASHIIGLGNGLISYLKEISVLQADNLKLNQNLAGIAEQHKQETEQKHQEYSAYLKKLNEKHAHEIKIEQKKHKQNHDSLNQQLQQQATKHTKELAEERQKYAELNLFYSKQVEEKTREYTQQREQELDKLVGKLQNYLNSSFVNNLGKNLVTKYTQERPDYAAQRIPPSTNPNTINTGVRNPTLQEQQKAQASNNHNKKGKGKLWLILALILLLGASVLAIFVSLESYSETTENIPPVEQPQDIPNTEEQNNQQSQPVVPTQPSPQPSPNSSERQTTPDTNFSNPQPNVDGSNSRNPNS